MKTYAIKTPQGYLATQGNATWHQSTPDGWAAHCERAHAENVMRAKGIAGEIEEIADPDAPPVIQAGDLKPGHIITRAGFTSHPPITVTKVTPCPLPGFVVIHGFNSRDATPRLMFRSLSEGLAITLQA